MANSDKNLVITPSVGSGSSEPTITFSGADSTLGPQSLQARIYPTSNGTLSFEGSAGQLFSITNSLTGTIFSVNDVSGLPSIEVFDSGVVRLARYSGRVIIGNIADNGSDSLQFATSGSIALPNINSTGNVTALLYTGSGANLTNINAANVAPGTLPGDRGVTAGSSSSSFVEYNGTTATAGQWDGGTTAPSGTTRLNYGGNLYATNFFGSGVGLTGIPNSGTTASSSNGASTIVARDGAGSFVANVVTAATFSGSGSGLTGVPNGATTATTANTASTIVLRGADGSFSANGVSLTNLNATNIAIGTIDNARTTANSANGASTIVTRGADGSFTANVISTVAADTTVAASHYYVEISSDNAIRPKTLANVQTEIVTAASVNAISVLAGSTTVAPLRYNGTTALASAFDGGTTNPSGTTRLNFGGYLYATRYYTAGIYDVTGSAGTPTIYPDVTTGSITIGNGLTTGTLNLGSSAAGAKTVNIGTSTGTTIVYGSTVRLPNAGTPGAGKYLQSDASGNATWQTIIPGSTLTNDTTTNTDTFYPVLANNQTSGTLTSANTSSTKLYFNPSTGQLNATNFNSLSDETKKENIATLADATEKTLRLRGVSFTWKDTGKASIGVIAQEVEQVIPEVVGTSSSGEKSVNYDALVGLLIQTIKEQNARIEKLESIIAAK